MRHGSLESGLGGFDYAAEMIGWENIFSCEINPFCRTILKYYWPKSEHYADVFEFDGTRWRGKVDIITCGFPCQPFSHAGKRQGTKDDRHIWPENMRIIREAKPAFVVAENVPGLLSIENGLVFEQVCADLEAEGYTVTPFVIPACATDKDHRRDRVWIVAKSNGFRSGSSGGDTIHEVRGTGQGRGTGIQENSIGEDGATIGHYWAANTNAPNSKGFTQREPANQVNAITDEGRTRFEPGSGSSDAADTKRQGLEKRQRINARGERQDGGNEFAGNVRSASNETWLEAATRLCSVDDGTAGRLDTAAISKGKWRTESLKGYGNAIVWEVAYNIFQAIDLTHIV